MRRLLFIALMLVSTYARSNTLDCYPYSDGVFRPFSEQSAVGFSKSFYGSCQDESSKKRYNIEVISVGINIHYALMQGFKLTCPLVESFAGVYKGQEVSLALSAGVSAGVFIGENNSPCILYGARLMAFGAEFNNTQIKVIP